MFKTVSGKAGRIHDEGTTGLGGRDNDLLGAPHFVSDGAQALPLDMNTIRQFSFGQVDRSPIPERPSTSGGPARTSDFPLRRDAWKRETRDDFDFPPPGAGATFYDFPLPGGLPTPDSSPKEFLVSRKESIARSATPDSIEIDLEQAMEASGMGIGMAIGSPTYAPTTWNPQRLEHTHSPSPDPTELSMDRSPMPQKHKSKWKMFGGLFGGGKKQATVQTQNFYQLQAQRSPAPAEQQPIRGWTTSEQQPTQQPIRGWTTSEQHSLQKKPDVTRAKTAPTRFDLYYGQENPEIMVDGSRLDKNPQQARSGGGNLMLDVDIPSVQMERYSVMFGSLLSGPAAPTATTPNLLARRQATLDHLKVVNEELAQQEHELEEKERQIKHPRRATSPQPGRSSPAFSLFPNTPSRDSRMARAPSPNGRLGRSNTSPAALHSPSRPSFAPGLENEYHATLMEPGPHIPTPGYESSRDRSTSAIPKAKKTPDLKSIVRLAQAQVVTDVHVRSFTPDQQQLSLSPETDFYNASSLHQRPSFSEPRQVVSKYSTQTTSSAGSATSQSDHSTSSSISITSTPSTNANFSSQATAINTPARTPSPQAQSTTKAIPIPMSKFTAPPQTHKTRSRSATTSTPSPKSTIAQSQIPRPHLPSISGPTNLSSTSPFTNTTPNSSSPRPIARRPSQEKTSPEEDENEARLNTLADVSIARQISVSRQQRQLLVPIKGSMRGKSSTVTAATSTSARAGGQGENTARPTMRVRASTVSSSSPSAPSKITGYNQNFPSPLKNLQGAGINVSHVTSPLSAVEKATREEWEQQNSILVTTSISGGVGKRERERLVSGVKPNTPTLVIVGGNGSEEGARVTNWDGSVLERKKSDGIAERRRRARAEKDGRGHEYRKSEKVVVERV